MFGTTRLIQNSIYYSRFFMQPTRLVSTTRVDYLNLAKKALENGDLRAAENYYMVNIKENPADPASYAHMLNFMKNSLGPFSFTIDRINELQKLYQAHCKFKPKP